MHCHILSPFSKIGLVSLCFALCSALLPLHPSELSCHRVYLQGALAYMETQTSLVLPWSATSTRCGRDPSRTISMAPSGSAAYLKPLQVLKQYVIKDPKRAIPPHAKGHLAQHSVSNQISRISRIRYSEKVCKNKSSTE